VDYGSKFDIPTPRMFVSSGNYEIFVHNGYDNISEIFKLIIIKKVQKMFYEIVTK
jgi:hypothetical protein